MRTTDDALTRLGDVLEKVVPFSDAAWTAGLPLFTPARFAAGESIITAGEPVTVIHFIIEGLARYYFLDANGREFNKSFSTTGQALSSVSALVTGGPSPFHVQALEACDCLTIRYTDLLVLADRHHEWNLLVRRLLEQLVIKKERREADFLQLSAAERYVKFLDEFAPVAGRIPNYQIASYLGITDVALSRVRKRLGLTSVNEPGESRS